MASDDKVGGKIDKVYIEKVVKISLFFFGFFRSVQNRNWEWHETRSVIRLWSYAIFNITIS